MGYEFLIAGLPELRADGEAPMSSEQLLELLRESLREDDKDALRMLRMRNDDAEVLAIKERYDDSYIARPEWYDDACAVLSEEDLRTQLLYVHGQQSKCRFVRDWYAFNQDMNNVMVATICRKHGFDVRKLIIGNNEVAETLRRNVQQKDFGLTGVLDNIAELVAIVDIEDLREREKRLDAMRFMWLEERTKSVYFSLENVLAYWLQNEMLCRWSVLTVEQGEKVFRELVADMKKGIDLGSK